MNPATLYSSNAFFRAALKASVLGLAAFAAIFCASAGYGLLKMLLAGINSGATGGIAELATHSGLTIAFFVLAGAAAYAAKKSFW